MLPTTGAEGMCEVMLENGCVLPAPASSWGPQTKQLSLSWALTAQVAVGAVRTDGHKGELHYRLGVAIYLQVPNGEGLLKNVGSISPGCQPRHGGQVAAVATHRLNDEHPTLGACCRLLDAVTRLQRRRVIVRKTGSGVCFLSLLWPLQQPSSGMLSSPDQLGPSASSSSRLQGWHAHWPTRLRNSSSRKEAVLILSVIRVGKLGHGPSGRRHHLVCRVLAPF